MRCVRTCLFPFILFFCISCAEEDHYLTEEMIIAEVENDNADQDKWIYEQMKMNYLWADKMKDSLDCDYSLPPDKFFEDLIVEEDRFSYCRPNADYEPHTKGVNLNETVKFDSVYTVGKRRIGYFYYSGFETEADVTDVIIKMLGIDDLILDVRNNPGGNVNTCIYLASLIVPERVRGQLFCSYEYNPRISRINMENTGDERSYSYFRDDIMIANRSLSLNRLFILTGPHSASASEMLINSLKPYIPVTVIGSVTVGKDVGMRLISSPHCKYVLWPITFRTYNADGESVPVTGIVPDIVFEADEVVGTIGDVNETLLSSAMEEITKNT